MTILNNIEIDDISYSVNNTALAIQNNLPVEDTLHVIAVVSNPCLYATRYILAKQFIRRMEATANVTLYVVEMVYGKDASFHLTSSQNPRHLQVRTETAPLWHKENMINMGVAKLLPPSWKAMAWIDADLEFESQTWATDTLKILNGYKDVVQLFSHAVDMDAHGYTMNIFSAFGYQYESGKKYCGKGPDFWHPGFAWACTRRAYEQLGGLYDRSILGSGDHHIAMALVHRVLQTVKPGCHPQYRKDILQLQERARCLRLGYVPGVIKHHFHGHKADRRYNDRWQILTAHQYNPSEHITYQENGLIVPTAKCPEGLVRDIMIYFSQRNEDAMRIEMARH